MKIIRWEQWGLQILNKTLIIKMIANRMICINRQDYSFGKNPEREIRGESGPMKCYRTFRLGT